MAIRDDDTPNSYVSDIRGDASNFTNESGCGISSMFWWVSSGNDPDMVSFPYDLEGKAAMFSENRGSFGSRAWHDAEPHERRPGALLWDTPCFGHVNRCFWAE